MTALYQLAADYKEAAERLAESGLDEQTITDTLEGLSGDIEQKAIHIAKWVRNLEAETSAIRAAVDEMVKRANSEEAKAKRLRDYLKDCLQQAEIRKVSCPFFVVSIKATPAAVVIEDEKLIPGNLMSWPPAPAPKPDKRAIAEAIKAGKEVAGARLEGGTRLEIK
jgi:hypothetical protein